MDFEIPGTLEGLDLDALAQLESQAVAAFDTLRDDSALDADGLARLRELATFVQSVRTQQEQVEQAALQVASELDDLDAAVHGDAEAPDGEGGDAANDDDGDADNDGDGVGDESDEPSAEEHQVEEVAPQPTPVVASLARRAARRQPKPKMTLECSTYDGLAERGSIIALKVDDIDFQPGPLPGAGAPAVPAARAISSPTLRARRVHPRQGGGIGATLEVIDGREL